LRLAQPTVSQQIRKLEQQLGVVLVHRSRAGCDPTEAAFTFMPYAESLIRISNRALTTVRTGHLRVGASSNIGIYILQPYVRRFLRNHDPALFDLVIDRNPAIAQKLEDAEVDAAVMEWWDGRPGFLWKRWRSEPIVLIVPPDHPFAGYPQISRHKLAELELLGGEPGSGTGRLLDSYFAKGSRRPRIALQLGSTAAVKEAVKAGLGVSLVLQAAITEEVHNGTLRAIPLQPPALEKDLFVIWRDTGASHISAPAFVPHLLGNEWKAAALAAESQQAHSRAAQ
jgi:DNA-binding transcriptional LysR family regulator